MGLSASTTYLCEPTSNWQNVLRDSRDRFILWKSLKVLDERGLERPARRLSHPEGRAKPTACGTMVGSDSPTRSTNTPRRGMSPEPRPLLARRGAFFRIRLGR